MFRFVYEVEDQRDWQRRPGCTRNPFSCFFCHLLTILGAKTILDLTYGVGSFYQACPLLDIIAVDIVRRNWLVEPREFHQADALEFIREFQNRVDVVVLDPPYATKKTNRKHNEYYESFYHGRFPLSKIVQVVKTARTKARYVVLKYMPSLEEEAELLRLSPRYIITWRYIISLVAAAEHNKVIRNATKIYVY